MPVALHPERCREHDFCYPERICHRDGNGALTYLPQERRAVVDPALCGDCPAPCINFCDRFAIVFARNLEEVELLKAEWAGTMSEEELTRRRQELEERWKAEQAAREQEKEEEKAREEAGKILEATAETFESLVLESPLPVIVDFWAEWCAPCKQMEPVLKDLARQYAGKIRFVKVNVDEHPQLAQAFGIQGIPTLIVFYQGQPVDAIVGAVPAAQLQAYCYQLLTAVRAQEAGQKAAEGEGKEGGARKGRRGSYLFRR